MTITATRQPCYRDDAVAIVRRLRQAGHTAYFAGGCVRDELLGIQPKDYDVATDATPDQVRRLFSNTQAVGASFGVILVRQGRSVVEVATFRSDDVYLDGRRPSRVHFTTAENDARRRDFTINGLFLDPLNGQVVDYVEGRKDLEAKILRAIGDPEARLSEDYLRLIRAVRFAARFGLTIEPRTAAAIGKFAGRLKSISPERIAEELRLMLTPPTRNHAWKLLNEFGLMEVIFRYAQPATATEADPTWSIFLNLGEDPAPFGLALAAAAVSRQRDPGPLFDPTHARTVTRAMRQALKISNDESHDLLNTLIGIGMVLRQPPPTLAVKKRFLARDTSQLSRRLLRAMRTAGVMSQCIEPLESELQELARTDFAPPPLLDGDDLVAAGLQPGKLFKRLLDEVYDAQLEGRIASRQQALEMALQIARERPTES